MGFGRKSKSKSFPVKVCTFDSELEFQLEVILLHNSNTVLQF